MLGSTPVISSLVVTRDLVCARVEDISRPLGWPIHRARVVARIRDEETHGRWLPVDRRGELPVTRSAGDDRSDVVGPRLADGQR